MSLKMLQITVPISAEANIKAISTSHECVISYHKGVVLDEDHALFFLLTRSGDRQKAIDALQQLLSLSSKARISILPVETTLPHVEQEGTADTREELFQKMGQGARLDMNFMILTFLSTIVALIGLMPRPNNVAVVIGAMVIAPLLGPNLAFAFGTSLGNKEMMTQAFVTAFSGISVAVAVSALIGFVWPEVPDSWELLSRTEVGLGGIALAAASGVAGVLSLTSGLSMTLVGVMVAVALLPPAATFGFMLGQGELKLAYGALLLLVVNVVCVNLSGLLVFLAKGIQPRLWFERRMATPYVLGGIALWTVLLAMLMFVIGFRPAG